MLDCVFELDFEGRFIDGNPEALKLFGYERADIPSLSIASLMDEDQLSKAWENIEEVIKTGYHKGLYGYRLKRKDGTYLDVESKSFIVYHEGKPHSIMGIASDITKRERLEEILRKEQQELKLIIDSSPIIIFYKDKEGKLLRVNKTLAEALKMPEEEFVGKTVFDLYSPEIAQDMSNDDQEVLRSGLPKLNIEEQYESANGIRWVRTDKVPIYDENGITMGLIGFAQDITEHKQVEEALRHSEKEKTIMNEIANIFLTVPDQAMYGEVLAVVLREMHSKHGLFGFIDEQGNLTVPSLTRDVWNECRVPGKSIVFPSDSWGESLWGRAIREKRTFYSDGPFHMPEGHVHIDNFLTVPVVFRQETIGLISVANKDGGYTEKDKGLLERIAGYVSPILQARLQRDRLERKRGLTMDALRESEEKYRSVVENVGIGIAVIGPNMEILALNNQMKEWFPDIDVSKTPLCYKAFNDPPRDTICSYCPTCKTLEDGQVHESVTETPAGDQIRSYRIVSSALRDKVGKINAAIEMVEDITERKKAEETIQENEHKIRAILDHTFQFIGLMTPEGILIEANRSALDAVGMEANSVLGKPFWETPWWTHSPELQEKLRQAVKDVVRGELVRFEATHIVKDGTLHDIDFSLKPIKDESGKVIFMIPEGGDITERKRAENALRNSEARFRSYFELPLIGIAIISPERNWLEGNDRLSAILGYPWQELKNMTWSDLTYLEDLAADMEQFNRVLAGEIESFMLEKRFIRKSGEVIWTSLAVGCVRKQDGAVDHFVALLGDITDRKESVKRLRESLGATIQAIAVTVETRDPYTAGHQHRVADLSRAIAMEMNLPSEQIEGLRLAGTIHDLGKISVPAEILSKPAKLTQNEFGLIETHPQSGYNILKDINFPWPIARMVLEHHERIDGSGYPHGLTGKDLLVESKILAVADVVEAMASHRPYRPGLGLDMALEEITKNRGILYDSEVVEACVKLFRENRYKFKVED